MPYHLIASGYLHLIYQPYNLLPQHVVHGQRDVRLLRHLVGDGGRWVERVGTGVVECEGGTGLLLTRIFPYVDGTYTGFSMVYVTSNVKVAALYVK